MKRKRFILSIITFLLIILLFPSTKINASQSNSSETQQFLDWFEQHKNQDYESYNLQENIYLDSGTLEDPIILDGTGRIEINCNGFSIFVRSHVKFDMQHALITTKYNATYPIVIIENNKQITASLTLEKGYIAGSSTALEIRSGTIVSPSKPNQFEIVGNNLAVNILNSDITLSNLTISATSEREIIGINASQNISLINCIINV